MIDIIFANCGMIQIGGNGMDNVVELAMVIKTIKQRASDIGAPPETADEMIVLAGKLSVMENDEMIKIVNDAMENEKTIGEILKQIS